MSGTGTFDLAAALARRGLVPEDLLEEAVDRASAEGVALQQVLVDEGKLSEEELDFCLSEELGIPQIHLTTDMVDADLVHTYPPEVLRRREMVPLLVADGEVTVVLADPLNEAAIRDLERVSPYRVRPAVAERARIREVLDTLIGPEDAEPDGWGDAALVLLTRAFAKGATEIHIEPVRAGTRVRHRVEGRLEESELHRSEDHEPLLARFRDLGRLPDDGRPGMGRFRVNLGGVGVDVDLSILPTPHGDSAVLKFGTAWRFPGRLDDWPIEDRTREAIRRTLETPGGLFIVNSPKEGRRRAFTYALLGETDPDRQKVMTLERGVFRRIPQWTQVEEERLPVDDPRHALELILGQRPDTLLLEGPSDWALAMALPAALEGMRLVIDAPYVDAADVLLHLQTLHLPPPLLDRALRLIVSVAALPALCPACRIAVEEDEEGDPGYESPGCETCGGTGERGHVLVTGLFAPAPGAMRRLLKASEGSSLLTLIGRDGHSTIRRTARRYVRSGKISARVARELL